MVRVGWRAAVAGGLGLSLLTLGGCDGMAARLGLTGTGHIMTGSMASIRLQVLPETMVDGAQAAIELAAVVPPNGDLQATVSAHGATGLKALYATLSYDPAQWQPVAVEWTDALASSERRLAMAVYPDSPGGQPGELTLGCVAANWDKQPGFNGDGALCRVRFLPSRGAAVRRPPSNVEAEERALHSSAPTRRLSVAPTSPGAAAQLSYDAPTQTLSWYYAFPGDYDQNGTAAITDLTALGQNFGETGPGGSGTPFPEGSLERQVDGDNNGEINGADITPIAQNLGRRITGYVLCLVNGGARGTFPYSNEDQNDGGFHFRYLWEAEGDPQQQRLHFSRALIAPLEPQYNAWVRPYDESVPLGVGGMPEGLRYGSPSPSYPDGWTPWQGNHLPTNISQSFEIPVSSVLDDVLSATDPDGDVLQFWVRQLPDHGVLDATAFPAFTYTPDDGYQGIDRFYYYVSDGVETVAGYVAIVVGSQEPSELRAFPGAEGFGASATGGRGGQVIYVTNLTTSGPGSLQAALDTLGAKYILFKVSGVINGHVLMTRGDVTVAGQTSPGGIIVRGWICDPEPYVEDDDTGLLTHPENFILRHIRSRPDFENTTMGGTPSDDGLRLHHAVNGIVDHFSVANAADEAVSFNWTRDVTLQNTLLAETLGDHAYLGGMLINYSNPADGWPLTRLSIHHNCWNRIMGRMPELARESPNAAGSIMELELSNNLLWDPGIGIQIAHNRGQLDSQPVYYALNWIGNRAIGRASFPEPTAQAPGWTFGMMSPDFLQQHPADNTTFFSDNVNDSFPAFTDYQQLYCCNDYDQQVTNDPAGLPFPSNTNPGAFARTTRHAYPAITYTPSSALDTYMVANAGAFPRDPMDRRLLAAVNNGVIDPARRDLKHAADDTYSLDFDPGNPPAAPLDTDSDGMPDAWETAHGLDINVQDHNGLSLSLAETGVDGYTNLEVYLNELADNLAA